MNEVVMMWREAVGATNKKSGQSLADPEHYDNLFPEYEVRLIIYLVNLIYNINYYIINLSFKQ